MLEGMFACVSNVSFDPEAIAALERRVRAKAIALGEFDPYDMGELWDAQGGYPQPEELAALRHARRGGVCLPCAGAGEVGPCRDGVPV